MLIHPLMIPFHPFHPFHPFLPGSPLACSKYNLFLTSKAQKIFCFVYDRKSRHLITARFGELMISSLLSFFACVQGRCTVGSFVSGKLILLEILFFGILISSMD